MNSFGPCVGAVCIWRNRFKVARLFFVLGVQALSCVGVGRSRQVYFPCFVVVSSVWVRLFFLFVVVGSAVLCAFGGRAASDSSVLGQNNSLGPFVDTRSV